MGVNFIEVNICVKFVLSFHSTLLAPCQDDILKCEILVSFRAFVIWLYFSKTLDPFLLTSVKHAFSDTILEREREGEIREEFGLSTKRRFREGRKEGRKRKGTKATELSSIQSYSYSGCSFSIYRSWKWPIQCNRA